MKAWDARARDEAHLLNPAFCSTVLGAAIRGYVADHGDGMPFPLAFLLVPIVLHRPTRDALPPSTRTSMVAWLQEHQEARVLFFERVTALKPHVDEALLFGMLRGWFTYGTGGIVKYSLTDSDVERFLRVLDGEARECVLRARFVGKWFASAGAMHMVMALWGLRP